MKRSRSSSFGNIRVLKSPPPTAFGFQWNTRANATVISVHAPPKAREMTKVGILAVSEPKLAVWQESYFLDNCFLCKKGLRENDIRFMYGDFRAFCSIECRHKQITEDAEKEEASKEID
ncbi:hypothetical protein Goshw_013996 [Gossypium schwendimanii]|uniref:FLZ-type domain-containing protein n=1 Tax=Gossypium schwendimanii TaxID=34291 RepID=A0A7J9N3W0_GOSSC|nr:hypothetical protein [Gossypium schwendimanii]